MRCGSVCSTAISSVRIVVSSGAEPLADSLLQLLPSKRITAANALKQAYFSSLPQGIHSIANCASIFLIPGVEFSKDHVLPKKKS
jgi:hypothetical protein